MDSEGTFLLGIFLRRMEGGKLNLVGSLTTGEHGGEKKTQEDACKKADYEVNHSFLSLALPRIGAKSLRKTMKLVSFEL